MPSIRPPNVNKFVLSFHAAIMQPQVHSSYIIVYLVHAFAANLWETQTAHKRKLHQQTGCQTRTYTSNSLSVREHDSLHTDIASLRVKIFVLKAFFDLRIVCASIDTCM